jgi:hypothetical protein
LRAARPLLLLLVLVLAGAGVRGPARATAAAAAAPCGLPSTVPTWFDFGAFDFWSPIAQRPIILASSYPPDQRPAYTHNVPTSIYFDLHLANRVGTPSAPADKSLIVPRANKFFDYTAGSTNCATPYIALNELQGASNPTPWTPTIERYRANVLLFLQTLAARGARPFLLINSEPYTGGDAADWWRQVAQVSDLVRESYFNARAIDKQGPILGSRTLRTAMRNQAAALLAIGVPPARLGLMLGFQTRTGQGGREGLQPTDAWLEVVKLETLAAGRVASELKLSTLWSWGWASYSQSPDDEDKAVTACVYLWTRAPGLCDGPGAAGEGFDTSRTEGQLVFPGGVVCVADGTPIRADSISALTSVTGDSQVAFTALLGRTAARETYDPTTQQVLAAERAVVSLRFHGSRAAYNAALARAHANLVVARGVIADELRRAEIERRLRVPAPTERQVESYYETYAGVSARLVEIDPAAWWLGDRTRGFALASLAPPQVFDVPTAGTRTVRTMEGPFDVDALEDALPLGAIPLSTARPAIRAALVALARDDRYDTWLGKRENTVLNRSVCTHDQLPEVASIDLTAYLPFLALDAGGETPH